MRPAIPQATLDRIFALRRQGYKHREIAAQLALMPATVRMLCAKHDVRSPIEYRGGGAKRRERLARQITLQRYWANA